MRRAVLPAPQRPGRRFVGDSGLTPQEIDGTTDIEVGYHVRTDLQGHGYATEAAAACRDHARDVLSTKRLSAIIHPDNTPSQRVAEKVGLAHERDAVSRSGQPVRVYATALGQPARIVIDRTNPLPDSTIGGSPN